MRAGETVQRLTVFVGEADQWKHRPVYSEIVRRAHDFGLSGAAVFRGLEGYGALHRIHTSRILSLTEDLPVAVVMVDDADRIQAFLPRLEGLVTAGLAIVDEVTVVHAFGKRADDGGPDLARDDAAGQQEPTAPQEPTARPESTAQEER